MTPRRSGARPWLAVATAIVLLAAANALVLHRLDAFVSEGYLSDCAELEARLNACRAPERVKVLVLGNSHAIAGLRVPSLAGASALAPDEIFSLAIPSGTAYEARWLLEAYVGRFPRLERVICGVDEMLVGSNNDLRARYLTRRSLPQRWHYAMSQSGLETRTTLLAGWFFPINDYLVPIKTALKQSPRDSLAKLAGGPPPLNRVRARLGELAYPWGYPPPWDHPALFPAKRGTGPMTASSLHRIVERWFTAEAVFERGASELRALADACRGRSLALTFVEMPFPERLVQAMQRTRPEGVQRYRSAVASATAGHLLIGRSRQWPEALFHDPNHLAPEGAHRLASLVADRIRYRTGAGATP